MHVTTGWRYTLRRVKDSLAGQPFFRTERVDKENPQNVVIVNQRSYTEGSRWEEEEFGAAINYSQGFADGYEKAMKDFNIGRIVEDI